MKKIIVAVLMVVALAAAGWAMAQGSDKGPGMRKGYGFHSDGARSASAGPWDHLNLSPDQIEKLNGLREGFFKEKIPLQNELMGKRFELKALWMQTNPDEQKILAKQKEMNTLRAQIQEKATRNRLQMLKVLTPEQQAEWINSFSRHRGWVGDHRGYEFDPGPRHRHHPRYEG